MLMVDRKKSEEKTVSRKSLTFYKGFSILDGKLFSGVCVDYHDNGQKKYEQLVYVNSCWKRPSWNCFSHYIGFIRKWRESWGGFYGSVGWKF